MKLFLCLIFNGNAATEAKQLPSAEDYTTSWLETRPGDPHLKTGIPPALLVISATDFLHKPGKQRVSLSLQQSLN